MRTILVVLVIVWTSPCLAQSHPAELAPVRIHGGLVQLHVSRATAGRNPDPVETDHTSVEWFVRGYEARLTVELVGPGPPARLFVRAHSSTAGTPTGWVELREGMPPADLIVGIPPRTPGRGSVAYEVRATVDDNPNVHRGGDAVQIRYRLRRHDGSEDIQEAFGAVWPRQGPSATF